MPSIGPLVLLTDFGQQDPFVGVMKGVIAGIAPKAAVVDLCHGVPAQDVKSAALFLRMSTPFFPKGTLFVCIVDPKVGAHRRILWARTKTHSFLAPDNGLLSWLKEPVLEWRSVERKELFLPEISKTFHGRDIFAPVAARLFRGLAAAKLGPAIEDPMTLGWPEKEIIAIDRFGNAVTSVTPPVTRVRYKGREITLGRTYADVPFGEPVALIGSSGLLELCVRNGSFAAQFAAERGEIIDAGN